MKLTDAADLIQRGYDNSLGSRVSRSLNAGGVQAALLTDGTLVIPGTNESSDWRTNLNLGDIGKGSSGRIWHQGFLEHARAVFAFAAPHGPRRVIGHSLGAAAAQIVAVSLAIPAICYASPQPLRGQRWFKGEHKIINICRHDDAVTKLPPRFLRFRHVGKVFWVSPPNIHPDEETELRGSHRLKDYLFAMANGRSKPPLPDLWG